jgi:hypothetical protein
MSVEASHCVRIRKSSGTSDITEFCHLHFIVTDTVRWFIIIHLAPLSAVPGSESRPSPNFPNFLELSETIFLCQNK